MLVIAFSRPEKFECEEDVSWVGGELSVRKKCITYILSTLYSWQESRTISFIIRVCLYTCIAVEVGEVLLFMKFNGKQFTGALICQYYIAP